MKLIAVPCVIAGFLGVLVAYALPVRYRAETVVVVDPQRDSQGDTHNAATPLDSTAASLVANSQVDVLRSGALSDQVIEELHLDKDPEFNKYLPHLPSPIQLVGSAIRGVITQLNLTLSGGRREPAAGIHGEELKSELLLEYQKRLSVSTEERSLSIRIGFSSQDPAKARLISNTHAKLYVSNQASERIEATKRAHEWVEQQVASLKEQVVADERAIEAYRQKNSLTSDGRGVDLARQELLELNTQLALAQVDESKAEVVSSLPVVQVFRNRVHALQASVDRQTRKVRELDSAEVGLHELERRAEAMKTLYRAFLVRLTETAMGPSVGSSGSRVVSPAALPIRPAFPNRSLVVGGALLLGLMCGAALAALRELRDRFVRTTEEIESILGTRGLGVVPRVSCRHRHLANFIMKRPRSSYAECMRMIYATLTCPGEGITPKVILITSAAPGEGKTSMAISIARVAALSGARCLLIDGDIRRPNVARRLGCTSELQGGQHLLDDVRRDNDTGLHYTMPPRAGARSLPAVVSTKFIGELEVARERYDWIFIDAPPMLAVSDTIHLTRLADGVVLVMRWGATPRETVVSALRLLNEVGARVLGTVLSTVDVRRQRLFGVGDRGAYLAAYGSYYSKS
jgi:uncharacterized protein involved in exopolysaccharide biosynthesis/Mrp family chromosome partitioning ATPase